MFILTTLIIYKSSSHFLGSLNKTNIFGMTKGNFKVFGLDKKIETRFKDVAGMDEAK